jgi:hypothetical protein
MKAIRLTEEARAAVDAATSIAPMTHIEEVRSLMSKGMKICISRGHAVWSHAPRQIALAQNMPYIAALPAALDLADYIALGGQVISVP